MYQKESFSEFTRKYLEAHDLTPSEHLDGIKFVLSIMEELENINVESL